MNTAAKLSAYGVALALIATGGWASGTAVGPLSGSAATGQTTGRAQGDGGAGHGDTHGGTAAKAAPGDGPGGLASSMHGYTFTPTSTTLAAGSTQPFTFRITGPDGDPVRRFEVEHEKRLHLIVVRRDTSGFQHVHPEMRADGTWTVPLNLPEAGSYRAFADFAPAGGQPMTLGTDLAVPGEFRPAPWRVSRVSHVDGYDVTLNGTLVPGKSSTVELTVRRNGRAITDLQPYLGAYGHLVALRGGDLAYLHVHPDGTPGDGKTPAGPSVTFFAEVPSAGTYRMFLDFRHDGEVHTAEFTVPTGAAPGTASPSDDGHGHN